jgi:hypothetical protein
MPPNNRGFSGRASRPGLDGGREKSVSPNGSTHIEMRVSPPLVISPEALTFVGFSSPERLSQANPLLELNQSSKVIR